MPPLPANIEAQLRANAGIRTPEEFDAFEDALAQAARLHDPDVIPPVLSFLDDESEFLEAMYSIVHLVEEFADEDYLPRLAQAAPDIIVHAPGWAETLHKRVLNSDTARREYARVLRDLPAGRRSVVTAFLAGLRSRKPAFQAKCDEVLAQFA